MVAANPIRIRGAIFDLDGTLLDSMVVWDDYGEVYLNAHGLRAKPGIREDMADLSMQQSAEYLQREYGITDSAEQIRAEINRLVAHFYREQAPLKPGVADFLHTLRERGVRMCIATATDREPVEAALARCGIADCFDFVLTCTDVGAGKNEPIIYREALRRLGTDLADTVVFEDALYAIRTAKSDGFQTVSLYDAHEKKQEELRAFADCSLETFARADALWERFTLENG
jgi:HAD superfamily hydrolase (TIGR01509 family)